MQVIQDFVSHSDDVGLTNGVSEIRVGAGAQGWHDQAPFSRLIVTAAAETVPATLVDQLAPGGIMVVPVGRQGGDQALLRLTREADGIREEILDSVRFVPLVMGLPSDAA